MAREVSPTSPVSRAPVLVDGATGLVVPAGDRVERVVISTFVGERIAVIDVERDPKRVPASA